MNKLLILIMGMLSLSGVCRAQQLSLSTNLADYANMGTLNLQASYAVGRRWTLVADAKYNPFKYASGQKYACQRLVAAGARYWPWHIYSGWWLSGKGQWQEYNNAGILSKKAKEGDRFGASFSAGYSLMLGKHFNLDFGAGFWSGMEKYVTYSCPTCGDVEGKGKSFFILPNDIMLAFTYIF